VNDEGSVSALLAAHPFTRDLSKEDLEALAALATIRRFGAGSLLIREGRPADTFLLLAEGEVAIEVFVPGAPTRTLQTVQPNSAIGWSWLVPPYRWEFDARAVTDTTALAFAADHLRALFERRSSIGLHIVERLLIVVAERLKGTRLQLLDLYAAPSTVRS
jgi:CRP-like cAMP-binding protein